MSFRSLYGLLGRRKRGATNNLCDALIEAVLQLIMKMHYYLYYICYIHTRQPEQPYQPIETTNFII